MTKTKGWFAIDNKGWRRMNAGRKMGHLIREGVSNILDLDDVRNATITVEKGHATIEDDGSEGFGDPDLIFTVFMTDKADSHKKRGRKGRGLKELLAAADKAIVETKDYTITFDGEERTQEENDRLSGTKVEIWSSLESWQTQVEEATAYLRQIIPPENVNYTVNGQKITWSKPKLSFQTQLKTTVIKNSVEVMLHDTADVEVYDLRKGEKKGWIFEMGIPIQKIDNPHHINVGQRVPMNDNRDTVNSYWLRDLNTKILARMVKDMEKSELRKDWVTDCVYDATWETQTAFAEKLVGTDKVIKSENKKANDVVQQAGYELVDVSHLPDNVAWVIKDNLKEATVLARKIEDNRTDKEVIPDEEKLKFAQVVQWFGKKLLGKPVTCKFFSRERDFTGFDTQADYNRGTGTIRYNVLCKGNHFDKPLGQENISTMVHEFAHEKESEHTDAFRKEVERLAGRMAYVILLNIDDIERKFGKLKFLPGESVFITCVDCGAQREIKVQDKFQVTRCKLCQRSYANQKKNT